MDRKIELLIQSPFEVASQEKEIFMELADYATNLWLKQNISAIEERRLKLLSSFSELLQFYPSLNHFILHLLQMNRVAIFDKLIQDNSIINFSKSELNELNEWIIIIKRLLQENLNTYSTLWNWSIFFTIINDETCERSIRENAFKSIGLLLNVPYLEDRITQDKNHQVIKQMNLEHQHHGSERVFIASSKLHSNSHESNFHLGKTIYDQKLGATPITGIIDNKSNETIVNVFGIPLYKKMNVDNTLKAEPLVLTKTTVENLRMLALAVSIHKPALVEGVIGSGKTAMIEELARLTGNVDMIKINLDESFDSKDLLGTYVCTDVPGEFKWQPGALTKAVTEGKWLLIEDLDLAPFDVISSLASLVESNILTIPSRNAHITPAVGFQLFATQCLTEASNGTFTRRKQLPMLNLWNIATIRELPTIETEILIRNKFHSLLPLIPKIIDTYETLKGRKLLEENNITSLNQLKHFGRLFSFRDLIKWCDRSHTLYASKINPSTSFVLSSVQEDIFLEAIDVFCGMLMKESTLISAVSLIASVWEIPQNRAMYYLQEYKPSIREFSRNVSVGRVTLDRDEDTSQKLLVKSNNYATTKQAIRLMEKIGVCIRMSEPVLLTGETGTGKTSIIQHLARLMGRKLVVHNLNQQTDSSDFIGGFRPVDVRVIAGDLREKFQKLFKSTFSVKNNQDIISKIAFHFQNGEWEKIYNLMFKIVKKAYVKLIPEGSESPSTKSNSNETDQNAIKQRKIEPKNVKLYEFWKKFETMLENFSKQVKLVRSSFAFTFVPGSLVKALRQGHWILLDEINLASAETLERLSGLLEGKHGTLYITERGDVVPVERHPNFRLFACMNPPTDVGKKNLPPSLRNRFSEFFMNELTDRNDLSVLVSRYLKRVPNPPTDQVVNFYLNAREKAQTTLSDGAGQKPHYSLRTLSRALEYSTLILETYGLRRALYEGFCMSFMTQMDRESGQVVEKMIRDAFIPQNLDRSLNDVPSRPSDNHVQFQHFWLPKGQYPQEDTSNFITTPTVEEHLKNLARIISVGKYPILLQGPTSAGKTTMINYLAKRTGHRFVRVNNHESTDIQEYFGTYITNSEGKLVFQEGILVEAVRNGYWIVLDELNLAPTDILEALNRLLDDNRELFIPETQETIKPHPEFQLFATQNPSGAYGGRKILSRAFRNRFQEIHVGDIPLNELTTILSRRFQTSTTLATKMINIMKDLQRRRQGSKVFAGKSGFITPRDLFRWAERCKRIGQISTQEFAEQGYILLAERLRSEEEKLLVKNTIEKYFERTKIDVEQMYNCENLPEWIEAQAFLNQPNCPFPKVVWTHTMKRLFTILCQCLRSKEPILFVGETGCGKTTVCQLYSLIKQQKLHILNCHQHTEPSDFLGSLRPVRGREIILHKLISELLHLSQKLNNNEWIKLLQSEDLSSESIESICKSLLSTNFDNLANESLDNELQSDKMQDDQNQEFKQHQITIHELYKEWKSLFKWYDGPLIEAMKNGDMFLIDEISLAEDAVLERLNSILEPERSLTLPEKGSEVLEEYTAHDSFLIMATMNPGGDYGKKELSPALRNRFTEIYVPNLSLSNDLAVIISDRLPAELKHLSDRLVNFVRFFRSNDSKRVISIRDVISWIDFIKMSYYNLKMDPDESFLHGAEVVILDGLGIGIDGSSKALKDFKKQCIELLIQDISDAKFDLKQNFQSGTLLKSHNNWYHSGKFGCPPFLINYGEKEEKKVSYAFGAPTTSVNVMKVLRALQIRKPILMEGSPGVGKTSLVQALAAASGHQIVRINLSEQTDMMDLLGTDLPKEGSTGGDFVWCDGIFLRALKEGSWVLLDELNLASQSVLEGLNSVLDHRGEIYIPEINQTIACPPTFRIFACQNPLQQGGGRKGLPKSFLNRFTKVYVNDFTPEDLLTIASTMHPEISPEILQNIITFNSKMHTETMIEYKFGRKGSPWEFNLRDVFRICEMMKNEGQLEYPDKFIEMMYVARMRTQEDRNAVAQLFEETFNRKMQIETNPSYRFESDAIEIGSTHFSIESRHSSSEIISPGSNSLRVLHSSLKPMEVALKCIELGYMTIFTGPTSSGKTSLVRLIAQVTGNSLKEFSMTSNVDTVELLGGFEQVDPLQRFEKLHKIVRSEFESALRYILKNLSQETVSQVSQSLSSIYNMFNLLSKIKDNSISQALHLEKIIQQISDFTESINIPQYITSFKSNEYLKELKLIIELLNNGAEGKFQWNDGILVEAIEKGEWAMIDNVNFCSPSVLDRLNSLLEPQGVLVMNERGLINGELKVVKPHPNFRLFLLMDPKYGEISRAMRNRGVEIYLPSIELQGQDALTILCSELPSIELCNLIRDYQTQFSNILNLHESERPGIREAVRASVLIWNEISNGMPIDQSLRQSFTNIYISKCKTEAQQALAANLMEQILSKLDQYENGFPNALLLQSSFKIESPQLRNLMRSASLIYHILHSSTPMGYSISKLNKLLSFDFKSIDNLIDSTEVTLDIQLNSLQNACVHFIEFATPNDISIRIKFLEEMLQRNFSIDLKNILQHIYNSLVSLAKHPLTQNILDRYPQDIVQQAKRRSFDLRDSPSVWRLLNDRLDSNQSLQFTNFYKKIQISIDWIQTFEREKSLLYPEGDFQKTTLLDQSYLCSIQKEYRNRVEHASISFFYILLCNMCTKYFEYTLSPQCNDIFQEDHFEKLIQFMISRRVLVMYLSEKKLLEPEILIHWNWFSKHMKHLPACSNQEIWNDIVVVQSEVDHLLSQFFQSFGKKNNLWKYGGKPNTSQITGEKDNKLSMLAKNLEIIAEDARNFRIEKVNQILLKGMCSIYWSKESNSSEDLIASIEMISDIVLSEQTKMKPRQSKEEQLQSIFSQYNEKSSSQFHKHSADAILPLVEHKSLQLEMETLSDILFTIHALIFRESVSSSIEEILTHLIKKLEMLIQFVTSKTVRTPIDMSHYQILVWKLKASKQLTETNLEIILSLYHSCLLIWHNRLWNNDLSNKSLEWINSHTSRDTSQSSLEISAVTGPNSIFHDVKSSWIMSLLKDWMNVPIRLRFTKIDQIKTVVQFLCSTESNTSSLEDVDWKMIALTFTNTLLAFEKSYTPENANILKNWIHNFDLMMNLNTISNEFNSTSDQNSTQLTIESLEAILQLSSDNRVTECKLNGQTIFQVIALEISKEWQKRKDLVQSSQEVNHTDDLLARGKIWCLLGFLRCMLIIPGQPIDPSLKYSVMLDKIVLPQLNQQINRREIYKNLQMFENGSNSNVKIEQMSQLISILQEKITNLEGKVVNRPENFQFTDLYRDMRQFLSMLSTHNNYLDLVSSISSPSDSAEEALAKETAWQFNAMQALRRLSTYKGFDDIWAPFSECIMEMRYGMRLTAFASNARVSRKKHVTQVVEFLLDFPFSTTVHSLRETLTVMNNILNAPASSISPSFDTYDKYDVLLKAIETLLLRACLITSHENEMSNDFVTLIGYVFETYTQIHDRITTDIRKKHEEDEAAIKYKKKVTIIETDEERIEKEMNAMLPTYVELYSDFLASEDKEDPNRKVVPDTFMSQEVENDSTISKLEKLYESLNSSRKIEFIIKMHKSIFISSSNFERNESIKKRDKSNKKASDIEVNQSSMHIERNELLEASFKTAMFFLEKSRAMDFQFSNSSQLTLLCYSSQALEKLQTRIELKPSVFDIYIDSNISEVSIAFNLLNDFVTRLNELLKKYEENPTLIQMIHICERILNRSITSPVAEVMTGLEVLSKHANDWEEYLTSPAGTIKEHIHKILSLISRWRRIELENWKSILISKRKQHEYKEAKWWFQFYKLFNLGSFNPTNEIEKSSILNNIFSILEDYLRTSTFGDLRFRVNMLKLFSNQIRFEHNIGGFSPRHMSIEIRESILNIVENMIKYYNLFVPLVEEQIEAQTKQFTDKLSEFISIAKWEDSNYYSVTSAGKKARSQLGKLSHSFGEVLTTPCSTSWQTFSFISSDEAKEEKRKRFARLQQETVTNQMKILRNTLSSTIPSPEIVQSTIEIDSKKLLQIHDRSSSIIERRLISSDFSKFYESTIDHFENLSTEIIVRSQKFAKSKDPQNIKKRALLMLLNEMKDMGLRHQKKSIEHHLINENIFLQPTLRSNIVEENAAKGKGPLAFLEENWTSSDDYYYKNIYLIQKLKIAINTPSEDLNQSEITRMLGYSENLFYILMKFRNKLHESFEAQRLLNETQNSLSDLSNIQRDKLIVCNYSIMKDSVSALNTSLSEILEVVHQLHMFYDSLTISATEEFKQIAKNNLSLCDQSIHSFKIIKSNLSKLINDQIYTVQHLEELKNCFEQTIQTVSNLQAMNHVGNNKTQKIDTLSSEIMNSYIALTMNPNIFNQLTFNEPLIITSYEEVVKMIQLTIQKIITVVEDADTKKKELQDSLQDKQTDEESKSQMPNVNNIEDLEQDDSTIYDSNGAITIIKSYPLKQMKTLSSWVVHTHTALKSFINQLNQSHNIQEIQLHIRNICSLIQNFSAQLTTVLFSIVSMHKAVSKLLYVLLNTFNTLLKDGFCSPQNEEEGEWSGETEFQDGTGMDDGEGCKDVSDQIENEDQLLNQKDMQPMENEKDMEDNDNGIEMESDFQSKLYDQKVDKEEKDSDDESEEEQEDLDKEMGDIEDDDPNKETVDKSMWEEEDRNKDLEKDDSKEDQQKQDEKEQKDELAAKENEQEVEDIDHKKNNKSSLPEREDQDEEEPEQPDQPEFKDTIEGEEGEQNDKEDRMEDDEFKDKTEPQFDDLNLEDDISNKDASEMDDDTGSNQEENDDSDEEALDQNLVSEGAQGGQQDEEDENVQTEDVEMEDAQDEEENQEADAPDASLQNEAGDKMEEDEDEGEDKENPDPNVESSADQQDLQEVPYGVQSSEGKSSEIKDSDPNEKEIQDKDITGGEEGGDDVNKADQGSSHQQRSKESNNEDRQDANTQFDPNPYRSLGDALKEWKEQLNIVENTESNDPEDNDNTGDDYEFKNDKNEIKENDIQMKAPATMEQSEVLPEIAEANDEPQDEEMEDTKEEKFENGEQTSQDISGSNQKERKIDEASNESEEDKEESMEDEDVEMEDEEVNLSQKFPSTVKESTTHTTHEILEEVDKENLEDFTMEDLKNLNMDQETAMSEWRSNSTNVQSSSELWQQISSQTLHLSQELCEQLRLILEPTMATKLKGDYKTGKRINMKKVIPYIASQYKKDKIWLRRTKPNKREYQVLIAIDDSMSMRQCNSGNMALQAMTLISKAMSQLEVGQIAVSSFGESMRLLHKFDQPFTDAACAEIIGQFKFDQQQTQLASFLGKAIQVMELYKSMRFTSSSDLLQQLQLGIIISDGRLLERETIISLLREAQEKNQMFIFVLIDNSEKESVLDIQSVSYESGSIQIKNYMDEFPFPYYIILRDVNTLPEVLSNALRQWFELISIIMGDSE